MYLHSTSLMCLKYFINFFLFLVFLFIDFDHLFTEELRSPMAKVVGCGLDGHGFKPLPILFFQKEEEIHEICMYTHKRSAVQISSYIRLCLVDFLKDVRYALPSQSVNLLHHF